MEVYVPVLSQYFDENDNSAHPIKNSIKMLYTTTHPNLSQNFNYKISRNLALLKESFLAKGLSEKTKYFH